jgi:CubicO group peptidase (beta-lactamase class C family)
MLKKQIQAIYFLLFFTFTILSCHFTNDANKKVSEETSAAIINLPKPIDISKAETQRIKNACQLWYDTLLNTKGFNGEMIVAKNGNIVFEAYHGTTHIPGNEKINEQTALHIASVTKTFTATAVLKLSEQGKLNLDDDITKYFPNFNYSGISIRNLLSHRSGLPNYLYFMEKLGWDKSKYLNNQDVYDWLTKRKNEIENIRAPNANFNYCNTNYCLLALLIEKITGTTYADFLKINFFIPLQMKNTFVFNIKDTLSPILSYDNKNNIYPLNFLDAVYGDKNIYTTARDLLIWDRALSSNTLLKKETLEQAYTPYSNEKEGIRNYGLGWRMNIYPDGKKLIYHNGWWHGSNAVFMRMIKDTATIIIISNKFNKSIYGARVLCNLFGSYYDIEEEEDNNGKNIEPMNKKQIAKQ